jgi:hypothetical protein
VAERSKELIEVGYYLSKFGILAPPLRFSGKKWNEVYALFYQILGKGRNILEFEHSLKMVLMGIFLKLNGRVGKIKMEVQQDFQPNLKKFSMSFRV